MAVSITGSGVSYGDPLYNQYGDQTAATTVQTDTNCIVKMKFASCSTVDQAASGNGSSTLINGSEVSMGIPKKSNNWYRLYYQTVVDDNNASISGFGIDVYRYVASVGWERILGTGSHWSYDNNLSDWYRTAHMIFWVPVHPTYPNQEHIFRLYARTHDVGSIRWNASIGGWVSNGGWQNNIFELWEVDGDRVTTPNLTRY